MEALIFAAGQGRRLRPLTDDVPKALVDVNGKTALARVFEALAGAGAGHIVVNAHHHAELVERAALELERPDVRVTVSREDRVSEAPLETGGGLAHARECLEAGGPIILHNADILTDLDLRVLRDAHLEGERSDGRLATLVVTRRETSRPLRADRVGVYARVNRSEGWEVVARHPSDGETREVGFAGVHVLSPAILRHFQRPGTYSIIDVYMQLVARGRVIACHDATDSMWHDIGTPERLEAARAALRDSEGDGDGH
ncbi:MAG: sugar phosphate nucleotidyltransferase [Gemmatimonadota bacterium]|nr:sugar phosphate nucleotidyltransferase [Gemmatimonadota bacterium]